MINLSAYGHNSDDSIFGHSHFGKLWLIDNNLTLNVSELKKLPDIEICIPLILIEDRKFPLKKNILRSFPGKNLTERK